VSWGVLGKKRWLAILRGDALIRLAVALAEIGTQTGILQTGLNGLKGTDKVATIIL
jgi:hypothetical protein